MKHMRVRLSICVLALAAFSLTASPAASTLTVAPPAEGEAIDLNAVRDAARDLHRKLPANRTVEVVFRPGVYTVTNTATLYKVDGHAVWRAEKPGTVRFRGSIAVPTARFRTPTAEEFPYGDAASRRVVRIADVADLLPRELPPWPKEFRTPPGPWLYRNGVPMEIARWPNGTDWMTFTNAVVTAGEAAAVGTKPQADAVRCDDPHAARWDFGKGIWFYGYWCHDWAESFVQGASFDPSTRLLRFSGRHQYGFGGKTWGFAARRFCALNALSELDAPGEWYLDREAKRLYVVAQKGEENASYELATLSVPFVKADGLVDFVFEGLAFTCAHAGTAVQLDNSDRVQVRDCAFGNLGGKAIQLTGRDSRVKGCRFDNLGTAGIVLAGGDRKALRKSDLVVEDCHFRRWARFCRTYNPGVLMQGCGQVVRKCVFRDAPHNAILFRGNDHLIESNEFDRVLMETGDAGAIYTGRDPTELGTMIRGNWFHDLGDPTKRDYTSAVYFDDCDWGDSVVSNRFERLGRGVLLGGGNLFRIEGNSFADCKIGIHIDSRGIHWKQWTDHPDWFAQKFKDFLPLNDAWRTAYPELESALRTDPFAPWNNTVEGNVFTNCLHNTQYDKGVSLGHPAVAHLELTPQTDGWTLVSQGGKPLVMLGGMDKAGPCAEIRYTLDGNLVRAVCSVTNATPDFKANLCMFRRRHLEKVEVTSTRKVGRWTRPFAGGLPVEEQAGTVITYGQGATALRYVHPAGQGAKAEWRDPERQHLPLAKVADGVYRGTFILAVGEGWDDTALAAQASGQAVAASATCDRTYGWFEGSEPLVFTARGVNAMTKTGELRLAWRVRDWDGVVVEEGSTKKTVESGKSLSHTVSFNPAEARGIYFVEVRVADAHGEKAFARTNLVRLPPFEFKGDPATSIFGIAAYWPIPDEESVQRLMDRMGVRYVRMGDTRLQHPPRIAFRHSNPRPHHLKGEGREAWIRSELEACVTNRNPCWECGNELNMSTAGIALKGGGIGKALLAEPYAEFVREVRRIMREEGYDQKVKLLSLGVAGFDRTFFERMRETGTWDLLDGFCLHPGRGNFTPDYPFVHPEAAAGGALKTENAHDADRLDHSSFWNFLGAVRDCKTLLGERPLYLTEVYTPTYPNSWWEDGLRDSADNTVLTYALALASGVKVAFYYQLFDTVWFDRLGINPKNREYFFGLVNRDLSFKPALMGYIAAAEALDGATFVKWLKLPNKTSHGLLFETPRGQVACLWDRSEGYELTQRPPEGERYRSPEPYVRHWTKTVSVRLPAKDSVRVTDSLGRTGTVPVRDGQVELKLDGSPQFVTGCRF